MNKLAQFSSRPIGIRILAISGLFLFGTVALAAVVAGTSVTGQSTDITYTQLSLAKPTDAVTGDLLLAAVSIKNGSTGVITAPSGWTLINRTDNSTNVGLATYYHVVGATEPGSYAWNISAPTHASGGITRYMGVAVASPIDALGSATGHSLAPTAPSVTTTHSDDQIVTVFTIRGGDNTPHFATPAGMTERYDTGYNPNGPSLALDDKTQSTAGASGTFASSIPNGITRDWVAQTIALRATQEVTTLFSDDFNRPDSNSTGNGWVDACVGVGAFLGISGNHYFQNWNVNGGCSTFRTDITQQSGVSVISQVSFSNSHASPFGITSQAMTNATGVGYGVFLDSRLNTIDIIDTDSQAPLVSLPYVFARNDVYQVEIDITQAPQYWMYVYIWDTSLGESKPITPSVAWTNSGANYSVVSQGNAYSITGRNTDTTTQATMYFFSVDQLAP